tara:strand:+ start:6959 stop:8668 length:1710 start_codon:yes stop_codon:yes gene_type:complete
MPEEEEHQYYTNVTADYIHQTLVDISTAATIGSTTIGSTTTEEPHGGYETATTFDDAVAALRPTYPEHRFRKHDEVYVMKREGDHRSILIGVTGEARVIPRGSDHTHHLGVTKVITHGEHKGEFGATDEYGRTPCVITITRDSILPAYRDDWDTLGINEVVVPLGELNHASEYGDADLMPVVRGHDGRYYPKHVCRHIPNQYCFCPLNQLAFDWRGVAFPRAMCGREYVDDVRGVDGWVNSSETWRIRPTEGVSFRVPCNAHGYVFCQVRDCHVPEGEQVDVREVVHYYHRSPKPELYFSREVGDIPSRPEPYYGLASPPRPRSNARWTNQQGPSALWKYGLGFEVEKNYVKHNGNKVTEQGELLDAQPVFAGWETDSSCGIEGITNVYGIDKLDQFTAHADDSPYLDAAFDKRCGGHVNMSGPNLTIAKVRPYMGLLYALYRFRLNGQYTNKNKKMDSHFEEQEHEDRYAAVRMKRNGLVEFRLVSAVRNRRQMINRFKVFKQLAYAVHYHRSFDEFMDSCEEVLAAMYPEPLTLKRESIIRMAHKFQRWLDEGVADEEVSPFLEGAL